MLKNYPPRDDAWYNDCRQDVLDQWTSDDRDWRGRRVIRRMLISAKLKRHPRARPWPEYMQAEFGDSAMMPPYGLPTIVLIRERPPSLLPLKQIRWQHGYN